MTATATAIRRPASRPDHASILVHGARQSCSLDWRCQRAGRSATSRRSSAANGTILNSNGLVKGRRLQTLLIRIRLPDLLDTSSEVAQPWSACQQEDWLPGWGSQPTRRNGEVDICPSQWGSPLVVSHKQKTSVFFKRSRRRAVLYAHRVAGAPRFDKDRNLDFRHYCNVISILHHTCIQQSSSRFYFSSAYEDGQLLFLCSGMRIRRVTPSRAHCLRLKGAL